MRTILLVVCFCVIAASAKDLIRGKMGVRSNTVTVKYEGSLEEVKAFGLKLGLEFQTKVFGNWYLFTIPKTDSLVPKDVPDIQINLKKAKKLDRKVKFIEQEKYRKMKKASFKINDEKWPEQWYLHPSQTPSMNVYKAWEMGFSGRGVTVAIVDTGIDVDHPDLIKNYNASLSYDYVTNSSDPSHKGQEEGHGTFCAGIVAAAKDKNCVIGIAYESTLAAIRYLESEDEEAVTWASREAMSLTHKYQYIDIYSNSWAPFRDNNIEPLENILVEALQLTIKEGRNGKGTIYTFASGNDGPDDSCSADAYSSSMYTISIAAVTQAGSHVSYAEPCTAILAATFSGDDNFPYITTTGPNQTCIDDFDGTSAACPQASGIIALTLQANPELTWRDIQHMIVEFSNNTDLSHSTDDLEFYINGAGKQVSIWTGFGLMDAQAMVENAKIWPIVPPRIYCGSDDIFINRFETGAEFSEYFNVKNCLIKYLEHVQVHLEFSSSYRGDVEFLLVSPMGTKSLIYPTRPFDNYTYLTWGTFMSVHSWGEDPNGDWELIMNPVNSRMDLYLRSWALDLYGTATDPLAGIPPAGTFGSPCNGTASCTSVVNGGCLLDKEELCDNICVPCKDGYHFSGDFCEKDCPPLYFIDYGFVNVSRTLEGIYAIYSCEEGYAIIEGDVTRTCGSDSVWTGIQPTCEVDCGLLDDPANGAVFFLNTTYDYDANYTCHEGFSIRYGDETRICSEEGEWTGIKPTCSRVCRQPESPEYGHVYFINTFVDSKAIFTCNSGYTLTGGDAEIVCGSDGKWSSGEPVCLKDCCSLEPPANGNVNFISTTTWSIATYTCLTGYAVSSGNSLRTCSSYGIWTGTAPVCDIDCGPLDSPANGTVISSSTTKGSTATYSCLNGLTVKSGDVLRACASDGSWTGTKPVCGKGNTSSAPGSVNKNFVVETCVGILAVVFMFI